MPPATGLGARLRAVWPDERDRRRATATLVAAAVLTVAGTWAAKSHPEPTPAWAMRVIEEARAAAAADASSVGGLPPAASPARPVAPPDVIAPPATSAPAPQDPGPVADVGPSPTGPEAASPEEAAPLPQPAASLPYGKGMWIWKPDQSDGGNVGAIVSRAVSVGLSHLYVRTGSSWDGFYAGPFLEKLLPAAHAAGLRVYGWDFPKLAAWPSDVERAVAAIGYRTTSGDSIDGFAADIETPAEGTRITPASAAAYGAGLRKAVGAAYPLIVAVPRPSPQRATYPYAEVVSSFDAIAPMVYWLNREPGSDVAGALRDLARFGKPIFPVGQAYDGGPEGGRPGVPPRAELLRFLAVAQEGGAAGASFWSWQAANRQAWDAIHDAPQFRLARAVRDAKRSR